MEEKNPGIECGASEFSASPPKREAGGDGTFCAQVAPMPVNQNTSEKSAKEAALEILFQYWVKYDRNGKANLKRKKIFDTLIEKINQLDNPTTQEISEQITTYLKMLEEPLATRLNPFSNSQCGLLGTKSIVNFAGQPLLGSFFHRKMSEAKTKIEENTSEDLNYSSLTQ